MKIVNHIIEVKLSFRGYYLSSGTENNNTFLVASSYGQVTIFNQQGTIRNSLNLAVAIEAIDFDYKANQIGFVGEKSIYIVNLEGALLHIVAGDFKGILIQNGRLWSIRILDQDYVQLEVYNLENYQLISTSKIEDIFGCSGYMLFEGFDRNTIVLWMAGGQDGQLNFLVNLLDDKLQVKEMGRYDTLPLNISPQKESFLNSDYEYGEIYSYPDLKLKKRIDFQDEMEGVEGLLYVDEYQILLQLDARLVVYNTRFNSVNRVNLFRIKKTTTATEQTYLCKDFFFLQRFGGLILIVTKQDSVLITDKSCFEFRNENQLELPFN